MVLLCSDRAVKSATTEISIPSQLLDSLVDTVRQIFPTKAFGYLTSAIGSAYPSDFVLFRDNHRNEDDWRPRFESYGEYFIAHSDAGFVASPEESLRIQKLLWERDQCEVAVFHSHQRHPANFSQIDYDLHIERFAHLWHLIISMRNPQLPQVRAFDVSARGVEEVPLVLTDRAPSRSSTVDA
ncbi:MAG: Mov34/MPN/PAD-1 family protein [Actinomycetota bacterium]